MDNSGAQRGVGGPLARVKCCAPTKKGSANLICAKMRPLYCRNDPWFKFAPLIDQCPWPTPLVTALATTLVPLTRITESYLDPIWFLDPTWILPGSKKC